MNEASAPAGVGPPADRRPPRLRWAWRAAVLILLALVITWLGYRRYLRHIPPPPPVVDLTGADAKVIELIESCRAAVLREPFSAQAWGELGMALLANDFALPAEECLAEAEALDARNPRWPYLRGITLEQSHPELAFVHMRRSLDLPGEKSRSQLRLANLLLENGRAEEAVPYVCAVLLQSADDPHAHHLMARIWQARGDARQARTHLERCLRRLPRDRASHLLLAQTCAQLGDQEGAMAAEQRAAELPRQSVWPDADLTQVARYKVGEFAMGRRAGFLIQAGEYKLAESVLKEALSIYPQSALLHVYHAKLLFEAREDFAGSEQACRRAIECQADVPSGHHGLGMALAAQKRYAEAAKALEEAIRLRPSDGVAHQVLSECRYVLGDRAGMIESLRHALRLQPDHGPSHERLAKALAEDGNLSEALRHAEQAGELQPGSASARRLVENLRRQTARVPSPASK